MKPPIAHPFNEAWKRIVKCCNETDLNIVGNQRNTEEAVSTGDALSTETSLYQRPSISLSVDNHEVKDFLRVRLKTDLCFFSGAPVVANLRKCSKLDRRYADNIRKRLLKQYILLRIARTKRYKKTKNGIREGFSAWNVNHHIFTDRFFKAIFTATFWI